MKTYQRVREHGTIETLPGSAKDRITVIKQIVERKQYAKVDGTMIDLFTASSIMSVYNSLSPTNQAKYASMPASRMGIVAFKLTK